MSTESFNLAIETSGRVGSFALGRGDELLESIDLPAQTGGAGSGGSSELMQHLDALCRRRSIQPRQITEIHLSIGPGSFTGLRVGVTLTKMFAQVLGAKVVAVPTLDVVARNAPLSAKHVAVGLNLKKETIYAGLFERSPSSCTPIDEPSLRTLAQLLEHAPRPLVLIGDPLPPLPVDAENVTLLPASFARAHAAQLWHLGREAARAGRFTDPLELLPLYVRPPEAVELWDRRHGIDPPASAAKP